MARIIFGRAFGRNFLTGFLVVAPFFFTVAILQILFGWFYRLVIGPAGELVAFVLSREEASLMVHLLIIVGFVVAIALIGLGTRILVLRRFFGLGESLLRRVPMFGPIYGTMRGIADTFTGERRRGLFERVVLLEWPRQGMYAIGFVTQEARGEVQEKTPEHVVNVFIPTTPNPTSGYLVLAPRESLIPLEMSVEEGMRLIISGGAVGPVVKLPGTKAG